MVEHARTRAYERAAWQREANFCESALAEICAVGQHVLQTSAARPWRGCLMHWPRCLAELQLCYPDLGEDIESVLSGNARTGCSRPPFGKRGAGLFWPEALGGRRLAVQIKVAMGKKQMFRLGANPLGSKARTAHHGGGRARNREQATAA